MKPWQMTRAEVAATFPANDYRVKEHHILIDEALDSGKPVPPEVLADYPELVKRYQLQEVTE